MNLQHLSDEKLDQEMFDAVQLETKSTLRVLHHLREVDKRRLFSKLKFKSLLDYTENRLGYPYDQAWRRIEAMRLLKEMPEIESKIADGTLNLTNIGYAQAAFKAEAKKEAPLCKEEKLEFLSQVENKSTRATQKLVAEKFGTDTLIRETIKPVSATLSMLNIPVTDEFLLKLEELKCLLAHSHPNATNAELVEYAITNALVVARDKKALTLKKSSRANIETKATRNGGPAPKIINDLSVASTLDSPRLPTSTDALPSERVAAPRKSLANRNNVSVKTKRYIAAEVQREVWARDQGKCSNCDSTYKLEIDHRLPFSMNGQSTSENLRLLCRNCNQRAAIESYGVNKMSSFLKTPAHVYVA